jgi:hypothetical protein
LSLATPLFCIRREARSANIDVAKVMWAGLDGHRRHIVQFWISSAVMLIWMGVRQTADTGNGGGVHAVEAAGFDAGRSV